MRTQGYCSNDPEPSHAQPGRTLPTLAICRRIACGEELKAEDLLPWQARPHGSASIIYNRMLPGPTLPAWLAHMEKTILVTGGSGFIGSNFILQWMHQEGTPVVNLDKLTYAGNPRNLLRGVFRSAILLYPGRCVRPRTRARIVQTAPAPRHRALRGRKSRGSFYSRAG